MRTSSCTTREVVEQYDRMWLRPLSDDFIYWSPQELTPAEFEHFKEGYMNRRIEAREIALRFEEVVAYDPDLNRVTERVDFFMMQTDGADQEPSVEPGPVGVFLADLPPGTPDPEGLISPFTP